MFANLFVLNPKSISQHSGNQGKGEIHTLYSFIVKHKKTLKISLLKYTGQVEALSQQLKMLFFPEDQSSIPSTHVGQLTVYNSIYRGCLIEHTHTHTHPKTKNKTFSILRSVIWFSGVKVHAIKHGKLSSLPGTHMVEGDNSLLQAFLIPSHMCRDLHVPPIICTH